jgi:hypothetical protein
MFPPPRIKAKLSYGLGSDGQVSRFVWVAPIADYNNGEWLYTRSYGHAGQPEGSIKESWAKSDNAVFYERLRSWLAGPLATFETFAARILPPLYMAEPNLDDVYLDLEIIAILNVLPYRGSGALQYGLPLYKPLDQDMTICLPGLDEPPRWAGTNGELTHVYLGSRSLEDLWPSLIEPLGELAHVRMDDIKSLFEGWAISSSA